MKLLGIIKICVDKLRFFYRYLYKKYRCKEYKIIKTPNETFHVLYQIKDKTWETNYAPPIFELAKERVVTSLFPEQNIYSIINGCVCVNSDIVLTKQGAYWDKYNEEDFTACACPADRNVFSFDKDHVYIKKDKRNEYLKGKVFSMLGVWSYAYSHFLFQFVCKLYYAAEAGIFNQDVILLTDSPVDKNIEEIYQEYLKRYPRIKRVYANKDVFYICEDLIFVPSLAVNYNECKYYLEYRFMTPNTVIDGLSKYLVNPLIEKVKDNPVKYKKIFLPRYNNRVLTNNSEVEDYFRSLGFHFLECGNMSLKEKADIFSHAEEIVAVHGSSVMNFIFCTKARCMVLVNNRYITELLPYTLSHKCVKSYLHVGGNDDNAERRSNFTISLEKIKRAYMQLCSGDFDIN